MNSCWPYAAIFSFFCAKLCTNMPRSTCRRLVQKKKWETHVFFLRKRLNTTDLFEGLWLVGTHFFGASATARSFTKKTGYLTLFHCSWRSAWYQICDIWVAMACGIRGWRKFGVICLNQLVLCDTLSEGKKNQQIRSFDRLSSRLVSLKLTVFGSRFLAYCTRTRLKRGWSRRIVWPRSFDRITSQSVSLKLTIFVHVFSHIVHEQGLRGGEVAELFGPSSLCAFRQKPAENTKKKSLMGSTLAAPTTMFENTVGPVMRAP